MTERSEHIVTAVDRVADALERIGAALEISNELERDQPARMEQQMSAMFEKLQSMLGGGNGFAGTPFRSDAIVELVADPLAGERAKVLETQLPAAPIGPDGS